MLQHCLKHHVSYPRCLTTVACRAGGGYSTALQPDVCTPEVPSWALPMNSLWKIQGWSSKMDFAWNSGLSLLKLTASNLETTWISLSHVLAVGFFSCKMPFGNQENSQPAQHWVSTCCWHNYKSPQPSILQLDVGYYLYLQEDRDSHLPRRWEHVQHFWVLGCFLCNHHCLLSHTSPVPPVSLINTTVGKALSIFRATSIHCTSNTQTKFKLAVRLWYNEGNEKNTAGWREGTLSFQENVGRRRTSLAPCNPVIPLWVTEFLLGTLWSSYLVSSSVGTSSCGAFSDSGEKEEENGFACSSARKGSQVGEVKLALQARWGPLCTWGKICSMSVNGTVSFGGKKEKETKAKPSRWRGLNCSSCIKVMHFISLCKSTLH